MSADLTLWPEPFAEVLAGTRTHEVMKATRTYLVGEDLVLNEWAPCDCSDYEVPRRGCQGGSYTGRSVVVKITQKTPGGENGLPPGLCVLSFRVAAPNAGDS